MRLYEQFVLSCLAEPSSVFAFERMIPCRGRDDRAMCHDVGVTRDQLE
jgi:hypothetical protein